jgi:hypothetical protein
MDQNDTSISSPNRLDPKKTVQLLPEDKQDAKTGDFMRARIFLFISLPILNLLFITNAIIISIIATMLILLGIGTLFDPISNGILKYLDILLVLLGKPFAWLWRLFFVKHRTSVGLQLKRHRRLIIDTVAIIAIIILLGATTLRPFVTATIGHLNDSVCLSTHLPWITCDSGFGVTTLSNDGIDVRIGLIADNTYGSFDQTSLNQDEKKIENLIFAENQHACTGNHITLLVVTMLSRTIEDPERSATVGLEDLQGSYLQQHEFNATHPAISICLAIANLGTADTANQDSSLVRSHPDDYSLPRVIHQIAQLARTDPSFRGIVGFTYSQQVAEALTDGQLPLIKEYQSLSTIPIVSPAASSDDFSNVPNFYRIASPDSSQGKVMAQFFCDNLMKNQSQSSKPVVAMLTNSLDAYSYSLQLAFSNALTLCDNTIPQITLSSYTDGNASTIKNAVNEALQKGATYIFFPGYEQDMDAVESAIHQFSPANASKITIIAGDAVNNVNSTTHYSYSRVYATSFTAPLPQTDSMVTDYIQQKLSPSPVATSSGLWIPTDTILSYDSAGTFTYVVGELPSGFTQDQFNTYLATASFDGKSGRIDFQGPKGNEHSSDRNEGFIYITCNDYAHTNHLLAEYSIINNGSNPPQKQSLTGAKGVSPTCS